MNKELNQTIDNLSQEMLSVFRNDKDILNFDAARPMPVALPNRKSIIHILAQIRELFYPRYFGDRVLSDSTMPYFIRNLMAQIEEELNRQIRLAFSRSRDERFAPIQEKEKLLVAFANKISCEFMKRLPRVREMMTLDVQAAYDGDPAAKDKDQIVLTYPGVYAIMVYRVAHELLELGVPTIPRMMTEFAQTRTGIDINPGATIGNYFFMDHGVGIVIGETTEIGNHVKLYQGVTLGALSTRGGQALRDKKRHPTIEDNVTIYANASVLGGNTVVGQGSIIGGGCFITESIPPNTVVSLKKPELETKTAHSVIEWMKQS